MKIIQKNNQKRIILLALLVVLIAGCITAYWYFTKNDSNQSSTDQVDKTSAVKPEQVTENDATNSQGDSSTQPGKTQANSEINKEADTPSQAPETPDLTRAELSGDMIKAVATLAQSSPGYCQLQLTSSNNELITRESNILLGPSYYTCSFSIPKNELPSTGTWKATVIHRVGDAQSSSKAENIEVN